MSDDFIGVSVQGDVELSKRLLRLASPETIGRANRRIAEYIRDQAQKYPPKRSVTRKQAYGSSFQSDKQRRWFFAALKAGQIRVPYQRTGTLLRGWKIMPFGSQDFLVINETEYAGYVMGATQSRMMSMIGWKTLEGIVDKTALDQAIRIMSEEIQRAAGEMVYA